MSQAWSSEQVLAMGRAYQPACVLAAAADWDVFVHLLRRERAAAELAADLKADQRALAMLLDALAALGLLSKSDLGIYSVPPSLTEMLSEGGTGSILGMIRHQANCLRSWARLSEAIRTGQEVDAGPSIRGAEADQAAFIEAMDNISAPQAPKVIEDLGELAFQHLLDVGGASGTWTAAFLRHYPLARATIFDLPEVIGQARQRIQAASLSEQVEFVRGDFYHDPLPTGADLIWLSAIIHQNSREQNRELFAKCYQALPCGGQLLIRDIVMQPGHTQPVSGALFAINMLVNTAGGGTFTLEEIQADLQSAGFDQVAQVRKDEWMNSVVRANKQ